MAMLNNQMVYKTATTKIARNQLFDVVVLQKKDMIQDIFTDIWPFPRMELTSYENMSMVFNLSTKQCKTDMINEMIHGWS